MEIEEVQEERLTEIPLKSRAKIRTCHQSMAKLLEVKGWARIAESSIKRILPLQGGIPCRSITLGGREANKSLLGGANARAILSFLDTFIFFMEPRILCLLLIHTASKSPSYNLAFVSGDTCK